ncbi:MAG: T9SS type A sorting domain-containing protein [Bacteroidetes bacterium]|nr:T9SS type A sorting domain-containing protein [Bacteroidota bacterium]
MRKLACLEKTNFQNSLQFEKETILFRHFLDFFCTNTESRLFLNLVPKILILGFISIHSNNILAATKTTAASGNWSSTTTWGGTLPVAGDDIIVGNGHTLTVDGNYTCNSLSFTAPTSGTGAGTLTVNSSQTLTITTGLYAPGTGISIKVTGNYLVSGAGTINCSTLDVGNSASPSGSGNTVITLSSTISNLNVANNLTMQATYNSGGSKVNDPSLDIQSGVATIGGNIVITTVNAANVVLILMNNGAQTGSFVLNGSLPFSISGVGSVLTTFNGTAAKVTYNNAGAQTVRPTTYTNLTLAGGGTKTTTGITVNGVLSIEGTATLSAAPTYGAAATLQYNTSVNRVSSVAWITPFAATGGVIIANTGEITTDGAKVLGTNVPLTINSGAKLNTSTSNFGLTFNGNFVNNGTLTANASNITIAGTAATQSIGGFSTSGTVSLTKTSGTATATGDFTGGGLVINGTGGTLNLGTNRSHYFSGNWTRTAGTLNGGTGTTLVIGGSAVGTTSSFTAGTGTVNYIGAGSQNVAGVTYNSLQVNGNGTSTALGNIVAASISSAGTNTLNMAGFQLSGFSSAINVGGIIRTQNLSATPIPSGLSWGGLIQYDATTGGQTIVTGSYSSLTSGGTSGTNTLAGDVSVNNTLSIAAGTTLAFGTGTARTLTLSGVATNGLASNGTIDMSSGGGSLAHLLRIRASNISSFGNLTNGTNSTVEYYGDAQNVSSVSYNHLLLSGFGAKTLQASPMTIAGNLTTANTASVAASAAITVNGNFTLASNTSFNAGSYSHIFKGNFVNNGTFTAATSTITMNGSVAQSISGSNPSVFNNLIINNLTASLPSSIITLSKTVTVNGILGLTRGYIASSSSNILNMASGSSTSGSSANSYVSGPMTKAGNTPFEFPIGDATRLGRLAIGTPSASSTFSAQYFGTPYTDITTMANSPTPKLSSVSSKEYWQLDRIAGTGNATVTLFWEDAAWSGITDCSTEKIRVAHWNGMAWENNNNSVSVSGSCSGSAAGTVLTNSDVTIFSPFTFGIVVAPLPVELVSFDAKCSGSSVRLDWKTASELNNDYFEIQTSKDAIQWERLAKINGAGTSQQVHIYSFTDTKSFNGTNYYRLMQVDSDGRLQYSNIIAFESCNGVNGGFSIFPNPSSGKYYFSAIESIDAIKSIEIFDAFGKRVFSSNHFQPELDLSELTDGTYILQVVSNTGVKVEKIIKSRN